MKRFTLPLALAAALAAACGGDSTGASPGQVTVGNNFFSPASVSPDADGVVTWTWNSGGTQHNVTFDDLVPGSGNRGSGSFSRDFTGAASGTVIGYQCTLHAGMLGEVVIP
jgi:plastocyanin